MIIMHEVASEYRLSHWAGVIKERNTSGLSIKAYCESIGVRPNVYFYWQRKLREAACQELLPMPATNGAHQPTPNGWAVCAVTQPPATAETNTITIEIGKSRVTAGTGVNLEHLSNVCRMLMLLC